MKWHKAAWRASCCIISVILLFLLTLWISAISSAAASQAPQGDASPSLMARAQGTPTVDPTMAALQKEQLTLQVDQLKKQNDAAWTNYLTPFSAPFSVLVALVVAIFGYRRWRGDHNTEQEKRDEDRFQKVVEGLGGERQETRTGAAIMLRTFLASQYKRFHRQTFDLAVANLRLRKADPKDPDLKADSSLPLPLDALSQALIVTFLEAFPLMRESERKSLKESFTPQHLDVSRVQLDNAYLVGTDLQDTWMPEAYLRGANLSSANLINANLTQAQLINANLTQAQLINANLSGVNLTPEQFKQAKDPKQIHLSVAPKPTETEMDLTAANLTAANLTAANLKNAKLWRADLTHAKLWRADLSYVNRPKYEYLSASLYPLDLYLTVKYQPGQETTDDVLERAERNLTEAYFTNMHFSGADLTQTSFLGANLSGADLTQADLSNTDLLSAVLWRTKLSGAKLKGAWFDEQGEMGAVNLGEADLSGVDLSEMDLSHFIFNGANLTRANLAGANLREFNLLGATLREANMRNVRGLTKDQLCACAKQGAIIDDAIRSQCEEESSTPSASSTIQESERKTGSEPAKQERTEPNNPTHE